MAAAGLSMSDFGKILGEFLELRDRAVVAEAEVERLKRVLRQIADVDTRGPRSTESVMAYNALLAHSSDDHRGAS
jgi:hypothetical protein